MSSLETINIFIASPGDVSEERKLAEEIITQESRNHFEPIKYKLNCIRWETHGSPGLGNPHPQARLNNLIDHYKCKLIIVILCHRFGSRTGQSDSGTKEEFDYAFSRIGDPIKDIKVYFCDYDITLSKIDPDQYGKVKKFLSEIRAKNILTWTVKTREIFGKNLRNHLSKWCYEYIGGGGKKEIKSLSLKKTIVASSSPTPQDFRNLNIGF